MPNLGSSGNSGTVGVREPTRAGWESRPSRLGTGGRESTRMLGESNRGHSRGDPPFTNHSCLTRPGRFTSHRGSIASLLIRAIRVPTALGHPGRRVPPTVGDRIAIPKLPEEPRFGIL